MMIVVQCQLTARESMLCGLAKANSSWPHILAKTYADSLFDDKQEGASESYTFIAYDLSTVTLKRFQNICVRALLAFP